MGFVFLFYLTVLIVTIINTIVSYCRLSEEILQTVLISSLVCHIIVSNVALLRSHLTWERSTKVMSDSYFFCFENKKNIEWGIQKRKKKKNCIACLMVVGSIYPSIPFLNHLSNTWSQGV